MVRASRSRRRRTNRPLAIRRERAPARQNPPLLAAIQAPFPDSPPLFSSLLLLRRYAVMVDSGYSDDELHLPDLEYTLANQTRITVKKEEDIETAARLKERTQTIPLLRISRLTPNWERLTEIAFAKDLAYFLCN